MLLATRRHALLCLVAIAFFLACGSRTRVIVGDGGSSVSASVGSSHHVGPLLIPPPTAPTLPGSTVLQLQIDKGRTVSAGVLTQWVDQSSNGYVFTVPGGSTGWAVTSASSSTYWQQYDQQSIADDTHQLYNTTATPWTTGSARTVSILGVNPAHSTSINTGLQMGGSSHTPIATSGGGYIYTNTATNVTAQNFGLRDPYIQTWQVTPGSGSVVGFWNGWPVLGLNVPTQYSGTPGNDTSTAGVSLGWRKDIPSLTWVGPWEECAGWASILSTANLNRAHGYYASKFVLPGVYGYQSDGPVLPFYGIGTQMTVMLPYSVTRLYTTATTLTISVNSGVPTPSTPPSPSGIVWTVDGALQTTIAVTETIPTPAAYTMTSSALDGNPHLLEVWNGPIAQQTTATPTGITVVAIQDPTGSTQIYPDMSTPPNRMDVVGDSISLGYGVTDPSLGAYEIVKLRPSQWNGRISFWASSARSVFTESQFDATFVSSANNIATSVQEVATGGLQVVWMEIGENDWILSTYASVAAWGTAYGTFLDAIHTAAPSATIISMGSVVSALQNTPNSNGWTLVQLRAEMALVAATKGYPIYVDASQPFHGTPALSSANLEADGYHPNAVGHAQYNIWIEAVLCFYFPSAACNGNGSLFFGTEASNDEKRKWGAQDKVDEMLAKILAEARTTTRIKEYQ
jgi:hypothetical protein